MPEMMLLKGLRIDPSKLDTLGEAYERAGSAGQTGGVSVVTEEVLAATRREGCKCEDPRHMAALGLGPLRPGLLVRGDTGLVALESGCTKGRWVCSRLDAVRRRYGV
jgi:hypothetical protein